MQYFWTCTYTELKRKAFYNKASGRVTLLQEIKETTFIKISTVDVYVVISVYLPIIFNNLLKPVLRMKHTTQDEKNLILIETMVLIRFERLSSKQN